MPFPEEIQDFASLKRPTSPLLKYDASIPWLVEAPLCAIEVYETILRNSGIRVRPLDVWKCHAGFLRALPLHNNGKLSNYDRRVLANYAPRELPYVLMTAEESETMRDWLSAQKDWYGIWRPGHLVTPFGRACVIVCKDIGHKEYLRCVDRLLRWLDLQNCLFSRSLIPKGYTPQPIGLEDLLRGNPGPGWPGIDMNGELRMLPRNWLDWCETDEKLEEEKSLDVPDTRQRAELPLMRMGKESEVKDLTRRNVEDMVKAKIER